jgi:hypothetical protein
MIWLAKEDDAKLVQQDDLRKGSFYIKEKEKSEQNLRF